MRDPPLSVLSEIVRCIHGGIALGEQRVKIFLADRAVVIETKILRIYALSSSDVTNTPTVAVKMAISSPK